MASALSVTEDIRDKEYKALRNKSLRLQQNKNNSERLEERTRQSMYNSLQSSENGFDTKESVANAEDRILSRIFPIFLIITGVLIIIISIFTDSEMLFPLYLGIAVTIIAVIWDIIVVVKTSSETKNKFLRQRID